MSVIEALSPSLEGATRFPERTPPLLNPNQLLVDNKSPGAQEGIDIFFRAKAEGRLVAFFGCSDARVNAPRALGTPAVLTVPSIAAGSPLEAYLYILAHGGVGTIIVAMHHDGTQKGQLKGCGGLAVKEQQEGHAHRGQEGAFSVQDYVAEHIESPDVIIQALHNANIMVDNLKKIPHHEPKAIIAASLDHSGYLLNVFGVFNSKTDFSVVPAAILGNINHPKRMYRDGIPSFTYPNLPMGLTADSTYLMGSNHATAGELRRVYPDLAERNKVQQPTAVSLSTSSISQSVRHPGFFGEMGSHFGIRLPYRKNEQTRSDPHAIEISPGAIKIALAQAEYPLSHAIKAKPDESFFGLSRLIIETKNIEVSRYIAAISLQNDVVRSWLNASEKNQIWIGQVLSGQTEQMEVFDHTNY